MKRKTRLEILIAVLAIAACLIISLISGKDATYVKQDGEEAVPSMTLEQLQEPGTRIAILEGSELRETMDVCFPEAKGLEYEAFADVFQALKYGKVDAALGFEPHIDIVPQTYPELTHIREPIRKYSYGFGLQKNEKGDRLCDEMNAFFKEYVESGRFEELGEKWSAGGGKNCMDQYEFTGENGRLKVATMGTWSPMSFYAGDELTGEFIELMNAFCAESGYIPEYTSMPYESEIAGLTSGAYDVIADNIARTPERLESINITDPLFTDQVYAFVKAEGSPATTVTGPKAIFYSARDSFIKNFITESRWKMLLSGFGVTIALSILAGIFGTILGGFICFLALRRSDLANAVAGLYVGLFRGTPMVLLLLLLNYVVFTGAEFPAFWVCVIGFSLDFACYTSEIFRTGIQAVPPEQARAAKALGFSSFHGFRKVVLPQALINFLPVYNGQFISMVKLTSIAGYISVMDLTRASDIIRSRTYEAFPPMIVTALIYLLLCFALIVILRKLDNRIRPGTRSMKDIRSMLQSRSAGQDFLLSARTDFAQRQDGEGTLYQISHLGKSYGEVTPLRDVNCEIRRGDMISVIGPSGSGKSTLLNLLSGMEEPDSGQVLFKGEDIFAEGYDRNGLRRQVGMVFQSFFLFTHLSIVENIMLAQTELLGRTREEAFDRSMDMLSRVGLAGKALNYPDELSGGQKQRVAIARAACMDPEMILFDEPTSALDPTTIGDVLAVIRNLAADGMSMVIVTHEMRFARDVSNRVFFLEEGGIYEEGSPEEIFDAPRKEKTREFIYQLKLLKIRIRGAVYDFGEAVSAIAAFGYRHLIDLTMIRQMLVLTEEMGIGILQKHYGEDTDVQIIFEYLEEERELRFTAEFTCADDGTEGFDPLADGDPISLALVGNAAEDLRFERGDGRGRVTGACRRK